MLPLTPQQQFLYAEVRMLAWAGSVQRAHLYKAIPKPDVAEIEAFRKLIFDHIESRWLPIYEKGCSAEQHLLHLNELVAYGTSVGAKVLGVEGYKLGVAQKLLNLLLKYLWSLGWIKEPPHCPVDRIILGKTVLCDQLNWTQMVRQDDYVRAIDAIEQRAEAEGLSIARWELKSFSRRF